MFCLHKIVCAMFLSFVYPTTCRTGWSCRIPAMKLPIMTGQTPLNITLMFANFTLITLHGGTVYVCCILMFKSNNWYGTMTNLLNCIIVPMSNITFLMYSIDTLNWLKSWCIHIRFTAANRKKITCFIYWKKAVRIRNNLFISFWYHMHMLQVMNEAF